MMRRRPLRRGWATPGPVYRARPGARLASTAFLIWWGCVVVTVALDTRGDPGITARVGILTVLLLALVLPNLRAEVVASPLGLRVNNGWRERRLRWGEVARFEAELSAVGGRVVAVLRTVEAIRLAATRCPPVCRRRYRQRQVQSMREGLASYQSRVLTDVETA